MKTIDATPTWEGILPLYIAGIESGTFEGVKNATEELYRMARLADKYVAAEKDRNLTWSMDNYPPKWERPVLLALVKAILKRGYDISIYLEEAECLCKRSQDLPEIIKNLAASDMDSVIIKDPACASNALVGWFDLIYNNGSEHEPMIVISDYSANDLCEEIVREVEQEVES